MQFLTGITDIQAPRILDVPVKILVEGSILRATPRKYRNLPQVGEKSGVIVFLVHVQRIRKAVTEFQAIGYDQEEI